MNETSAGQYHETFNNNDSKRTIRQEHDSADKSSQQVTAHNPNNLGSNISQLSKTSPPSTVETGASSAITQLREVSNTTSVKSNNVKFGTVFMCDVCNEKHFPTYEEAVEHEKICNGPANENSSIDLEDAAQPRCPGDDSAQQNSWSNETEGSSSNPYASSSSKRKFSPPPNRDPSSGGETVAAGQRRGDNCNGDEDLLVHFPKKAKLDPIATRAIAALESSDSSEDEGCAAFSRMETGASSASSQSAIIFHKDPIIGEGSLHHGAGRVHGQQLAGAKPVVVLESSDVEKVVVDKGPGAGEDANAPKSKYSFAVAEGGSRKAKESSNSTNTAKQNGSSQKRSQSTLSHALFGSVKLNKGKDDTSAKQLSKGKDEISAKSKGKDDTSSAVDKLMRIRDSLRCNPPNRNTQQHNNSVGTRDANTSSLNQQPVPFFPGHPALNLFPCHNWVSSNPLLPVFPGYSALNPSIQVLPHLNWMPSNLQPFMRVHPYHTAPSLQGGHLLPPHSPPMPLPQARSPEKQNTQTNNPTKVATQKASISKECCKHHLNPAPIPYDPLDDEVQKTTPLEEEIAWLLEESQVLLPPSANKTVLQKELVVGFAWRHGSLLMREKMVETYPSEIKTLLSNLNDGQNNVAGDPCGRLTLVDGFRLLCPSTETKTSLDSEKFTHLRSEARKGLQLGFRRSEAIERELNAIQVLRWREAVEEVGEPGIYPIKQKQSRHRRKRLKHEALLQTALGQAPVSPSTSSSQAVTDLEKVASTIPLELTPLEDEVAWLVEESLLLLPQDMIASNTLSTDQKNGLQTQSYMSAGLVTQSSQINWDYVAKHASEALKEVFNRNGGLRRRPLQRIIRYHQKEVRCAFARRRDDIASLLLLRGYRRKETEHSLPSNELLVTTGLDKVWAVRLMRRKQTTTGAEDLASAQDLRTACNERVGDRKSSENVPKQPKEKKTGVRLDVTQKAQSSILTALEEEIAWLREEFELETGVNCFDWDYIEKRASVPLFVSLVEKKCAPSIFPSVAGFSKLHTMVRGCILNDFNQKRADVRHAIKNGFCRDPSKHDLPEIPSAPASFDSPTHERKNGICVGVEYVEVSDDVNGKDTCGAVINCEDICEDSLLVAKKELNASPSREPSKNSPLPDDCVGREGRDGGKEDEDENLESSSSCGESMSSDQESEGEDLQDDDEEYEVSSDEYEDDDLDVDMY